MITIREPQVFLVGETSVLQDGMAGALAHLDAHNWTTDAPSDAEYLAEVAGKVCYMSFSTDLNANLTKVGGRNNHQYLQEGIIAQKHGSVLEHVWVNVLLLDVSRVLTHELVRHGDGTAFSQESGRYVRKELAMYIPTCVRANPNLLAEYLKTISLAESQYKRLVDLSGINSMEDFGQKKEMTSALRRVLPGGAANAIMFSANHRALRHIITMRTSRHAEEEIRIVFAALFQQLADKYPNIYADGSMESVAGIPEITFASEKV